MINSAFYTPERRQPGPDNLRPPLTQLHAYENYGIVAMPLVVNGTCILDKTSHDGKERLLACVDEATLDVKWQTQPDEWIDTPISCNGFIYLEKFSTSENVFYEKCTGLRTLNEMTISDLDRVCIGQYIIFHCFTRKPIKERSILCVDLKNFEAVWKYVIDNSFLSDNFAANNEFIILKNGKNQLICLDTANGNEKWQIGPLDTGLFADQRELDFMPDDIYESGLYNLKRTTGYPTIFDNKVITPMFGNRLVGIDINSHKVIWSVQSDKTHNFTCQAYGNEMYAMGNGYIEAWDMRTGEQTRSVKIDVGQYADKVKPGAWRFTVSESHIFVIVPNIFYAVNKQSGLVEWAYEPGKEIREDDQPYIANGRIYFRTLGGLYVFEGADGYLPPETA